jgi:DNA repair protein RadC
MTEHAGHRRRIFARLAEGTLCEHEYLEALLFYAIPRRNTNDIAHRLLAKFKDINGVLNASQEELRKVEGIGESAAALFALLNVICAQYRPYTITDGEWPSVFNREEFLSFMKSHYEKRPLYYEWLDVYLINSAGEFYGCRRFSGRNFSNVSVSADTLGELISREKPSGIVIVHNHASQTPTPSQADDNTTERIIEFCNLHKVLLCDHVIYAKTGLYSYYKSGRLERFSKRKE